MRLVRYLLIAAMLLSMFWLVPSEVAGAEIIEIPMDLEEMPEVDERFYTSDTHYEDPSLTVDIQPGRAFDTDYLVVRVKIANATQLRSHVAAKTAYGDRMAQRVNAVLALTGDDFRDNKAAHTRKYVVRQGKDVFVQSWRDKSFFDLLFIDSAGDFHILAQPTLDEVEAFMAEHEVVNTFNFGPALWIDGEEQEPPKGQRANGVGWGKKAQRLCFCQTGPLEYVIIVTGGPDNPKCKGLTGEEFMEVIRSECEPQQVYNLDGGNAAWVVFKGQKINLFGRTLTQGKRAINDIIYFASAWQED